MGRKIRRKTARGAGSGRSPLMERSRSEFKAECLPQSDLSTHDLGQLSAVAAPDALADALVARDAARVDTLGAIPEKRLRMCLLQLHHLHEVSSASGISRDGPLLLRRESGNIADHMLWATQSAIAAIRLLLAGQFVGAAILVRQQLGRWTLLLADTTEPAADQLTPESADDLINRAWTDSALAALGRRVGDVLASGRFDDIDDTDQPIAGLLTTPTLGAIRLSNGRSVRPATIYHKLSQIASGRGSSTAVRWECLQKVNQTQMPPAIDAVVCCISDGLELCILNLRYAVRNSYRVMQPPSTESSTAPRTDFAARLPDFCDAELPNLKPGLIPITPIALATYRNWVDLGNCHDQYCRRADSSLSANQPPRAEVAKLAFLAHRYTRFRTAEKSHLADLESMAADLVVPHMSQKNAYILTAELAVLCAKENRSRHGISVAAMLISSTLRSGYWLWLEDDDRAMGILRWTLHHTARLKTWSINAELARQLESGSRTSHRDWILAAGWQDLLNLDRALFEFAHANPDSRTDAAATLRDDPSTGNSGPVHARRTRQEVLNRVTALAASEIIRIIAAQQSMSIAQAMQEMLRRQGLDTRCDLQTEDDSRHATQPNVDRDAYHSPRSASEKGR
jgi:hypothetical protein